jgi:hypothetical protein
LSQCGIACPHGGAGGRDAHASLDGKGHSLGQLGGRSSLRCSTPHTARTASDGRRDIVAFQVGHHSLLSCTSVRLHDDCQISPAIAELDRVEDGVDGKESGDREACME